MTFRIGLTGGIGSGKSTVATLFAELGAFVIDADKISRSVTAVGGSAIKSIRKQFGTEFLQADGSLNRDHMRQLVFNDAFARDALEGIIHPLIQQEMRNQLQNAVLMNTRLVVYDIPLLTESSHWRQELDNVLVIDCSHETQIYRVMTRNSFTREATDKIIASQASRSERLKVADLIIFNENITLDQLRGEVCQVAEVYGL